ncbi:MAG: mechanosensitive ion channel family protein, partial [Desulforhopalus sp.]
GTVLLLLIAVKIVMIRESVAREILATKDGEEVSWALKQFAAMWHVFALLYLFGIWGVWINTILTGTSRDSGALIFSLLIIPLFLILDRIGSWLVGTIAAALEMHEDAAAEEQKREKLGEAYVSPEEKQRRIKTFLMRAFRAFITLTLLVWVLSLWGVDFPLAGNIVKAAFDILITLALALFFWRYISMFIEQKIQESLPDEEEEESDDAGEFGPTRQLGRSYTLLPMIRRFIATTLMVMVSLIVLSAIGVDIGPLLAGAGVIGLAIGFGAQKLVSDVLSGIFYLLDDAFRVGEYIQAGSVMGTVENITLRNVMLRHHRGMLQIIPHSELGSITNFMRGGIVVKFNLEFPYDTDVELVRKTIKKVGQAMLEDEELGPDFIRPVKSQGVYEITNSVMVIRVKFTAKPGRQFLIRREAFRRITDALAAKNVHYAHRKVIVEVPQAEGQQLSEEKIRAAVEAGAAAGRITLDKTSEQEDRQAPDNDQF